MKKIQHCAISMASAVIVAALMMGCGTTTPPPAAVPGTVGAVDSGGSVRDLNAGYIPAASEYGAVTMLAMNTAEPPPVVSPRDEGVRRFKTGDEVTVRLINIPTPQTLEGLSVNPDGCIRLPFLGALKVEGRTTSEVEDEARRRYIDEEIFKEVDVIVEPPPNVFYVKGAVARPNRYLMIKETTFTQALAVAGDINNFGHKQEFEVTRDGGWPDGKSVRKFRMDELDDLPREDILVRDGDVIFVPISVW